MSERFPSIRHLAGYVEAQLTQFTQLKAAILEVQAVMETLVDRQSQVAGLDTRLQTLQDKIHEVTASHETHMKALAQQRTEAQQLLQHEQQERVTARAAWQGEVQQQQQGLLQGRGDLAELQRQVDQKQREVEQLRKSLEATVNAVLSKR